MSKNNKIITAAIAVVALLIIIGAVFASGILAHDSDDVKSAEYEVNFIDGDDILKSISVKENNLVNRISDPVKEGYVFTGWYSDKELTNEFDFNDTYITENTNIYAKWVKSSEPEPGDITFTVTFNTDGGNEIASQIVKKGENAVRPADPIKSGYKFAGWYSDSSFTTEFNFKSPINFDITLYAKFTLNQGGGGGGAITPPPVTSETNYTITYDSNGADGIAPEKQTLKENESITISNGDALTKTGYSFVGWNTKADGTGINYAAGEPVSFNDLHDNLTLYAKWAVGTYEVDKNNDTVTVTITNDQINEIINSSSSDDSITLVDASAFNTDSVSIDSSVLQNVKENLSDDNESNKNKKIEIALPNASIELGKTAIENILSKSGGTDLSFSASKIDNLDTNVIDKSDVVLDSNSIYEFKIGDGSISTFGEVITVSIPYDLDGANEEDIVVYYLKDNELLQIAGKYDPKNKCVNIQTDHFSTFAVGNIGRFTVNFDLDGGVFSDGFKPSDYVYLKFNANIKEITPTKTGYSFNGWDYNGSIWDFTNDVVKKNISLKATWTQNSYNIKYELNGGSSSDYDKKYTIKSETINLGKPVKAGHTFQGWFTDDTLQTPFNYVSGVTCDNLTLYAKWSINEYSVTLLSGEGYKLNYLNNQNADQNIKVKYGDTFSFTLELDGSSENSNIAVKDIDGNEIRPIDGVYTLNNITKDQVVAVEGIEADTVDRYNMIFANEGDAYSVNQKGPVEKGNDFTFTISLTDAYSKSAALSLQIYGSYDSFALDTSSGNNHTYTIKNVRSDLVIIVNGLEKNTYTVTFMSENKKILDQTVTHGESASLIENITRPGYIFGGWALDTKGITIYNNQPITEDTTLYAVWSAGSSNYFIYVYQEKVQYSTDANKYELIKVEQISEEVDTIVSAKPESYYSILGSSMGFTLNDESILSGKVLADKQLVLSLYFDRVSFTIHFLAPDGTQYENNVAQIKEKYGCPIFPIKVTLPGNATLNYWYETDETEPFLFSTMPDHDLSLHSKFTNVYNLKYDANEGKGKLPLTIGFTNGTTVILYGPGYPEDNTYALTRVGYTFSGWMYDSKTYQPGNSFIMPAEDVTLVAEWTANKYIITFNSNGGTGSMNDQPFTYDETKNLTANTFTKEGYKFIGWSKTTDGSVDYADQASVSNLTSENKAEVTLYAKWTANQYTISFNSNGGSAVASITANYATAVSKPNNPTKEGYEFAGWHSDEELTAEYTFDKMPAENITLYAKWTAKLYDVTFHYNNETDNTTDPVKFNNLVSEPNVSRLGYTLEGWYSDSNFSTKWNFETGLMPAENIDLYANWNLDTYTIKLHNYDDVQSIDYDITQDVSLPPASREGCTFKGWFETGSQTEFDYVKGTTVGNIDLYADFTINKYTITFNSNGGSEVDPITDYYATAVSKPNNPTKEGHEFTGWYSDEELTAEYIFDKIPADNITLYAKWTKSLYTLTINYVYEDGSKAYDSYVNIVEYGETYTVTSPSIETLLPDVPTVTGTMPANDLTITITYGNYLINIDGNNYRTIEDALASAQEGDRLILLRDYTIQKDITIPKGILLVLPCSDDDKGYDLTAEYEDDHNPDGTMTDDKKYDHLYRTLTVSSDATLTVDGQLLVNAVTGRAAGGYRVMDITGGYAQIQLEGNIIVKDKAILEVCGYVKGNGQITAESGAEVRDMYIVQHWRGGSQALAIYNGNDYHKRDLFPFTEYDCHNIQSTLRIDSGASLLGNVKMHEKLITGYHYTRFPQIDNDNGLIRLSDGAYLVRSYDENALNGSNSDMGRTIYKIYGGSTFSHSTLVIVGVELSTKDYLYPIDGDLAFELYSGNYFVNDNFKIMTGAQVSLYENASLTINADNELVFYDEFTDVKNLQNTEYPIRHAASLTLFDNSTLNIYGSFAGIISFEESGNAKVNISDNATLQVNTSEINGYIANDDFRDQTFFRNLHFETKYQYEVTFETNGGSEVTSMKYFLGDYLEDLPESVKTGFDFKGWYLNSNLTQKYNYEELTGNTILYAGWEDSKYTVSFETNRGSSIAAQEILFNNTVAKPNEPTRSGYAFAGWYSDAALESEYDFSTLVTENITLYAKWTAVEYTVLFITNNGENLDSIRYTADDASLNIQEIIKIGYTFEKWCIDKELTIGFEFKQYETSGDLTLYAKWVPVVYSIKYYDGTQLNLDPSSYAIEDSITLPTIIKSGYEFAGWRENSDLSGDAIFTIVEGTIGNKVYYASWKESVYSITYMDGKNKIENLSPVSYITTERTDLPTPSKEGYAFNGWYSDADFENKVSSIPIGSTEDKIFYAKFTINQYTITFNSNGGSEVGAVKQDYGTTIAKPADPTNTGYTFAGWFKDDGTFLQDWNFETDTIPVDGTILYANWNLDTYTITLHDGDSTSTVNYDVTMDSVSLDKPSKEGYAFKGWFEKDSQAEFSYIKGTTVGNIDLYADFTINQYTITFNSNGGSAVDAVTQDYGTTIAKPADPTKTGYTFAGWFKDNNTFLQEWNFETDTIPVNGTTLYDKWTPIVYSVIFDANSGTGNMSNQTFTYDETKNLTANTFTKEGYKFLGWSETKDKSVKYADQASVINLASENEAEVTLYAVWQINQYTITFESNGGSAVTSITQNYGTAVNDPEYPTREGYTFAGWFTDAEFANAYTFGKMPAENITLYAKWTINQYTITFNSNGGSAVNPIEQNYGTTIEKSADPTKEGHSFAGWFKDETLTTAWNFNTDTMPINGTTLYAKWDVISYNVKYYVDSEVFLDKTVNYGESVPKPTDPTKTGYAFKGWGEIPETMPAKNLEFYAIFEINSYTITYMIDGVTVNTPTYKYGAEISPYQPAAQEGKEFSGWSPAIPDTMPAYNMTVSGSFNASMFTITYYVDETQYESPQSVKFGEAVTPMTAPTKEGYTFKGWDWNGDEEGLGEAPQTMPAKHLSIHGYFTINSYCVTFHHNNGTNNTTTSVEFNSSITEPNVSRLGYKLDGWYLEDSFTTKWDFNNPMPANDIDLYAKWNLDAYTIKLHNGSDVQSISYNITQDVSLPSASKEGYTFNGWFEQNSQAAFEYIKGTTVGNKDLYAVWQINQYTITFESNDGSPVKNITEDYGTTITKPTDPTKTGYTFGGWFKDDAQEAYVFTTIPAENITLYAKWDLDSYTITYYDGSSEISNLDPTSYTIESGEITLDAATKTGYTFEGWYVTADLSGTAVTSIPVNSTGNKVFHAKFVANSYSVIFNKNGGTGSMDPQTFTYGISKNLTANTFTKEGYKFLGWSETKDKSVKYADQASVINLASENEAEVTLYAVWQINQYTITFESNGGSAVTSITQNYGTAVNDPEYPTREGYTFAGWFTDAEFANAYTFGKMPAENITLYAKWTINQYTITFNSNGGSAVNPIEQNYGTTIEKSADPTKEGHSFAGWFKDETLTTAWNFNTDTMPINGTTLYAKWDVISYNVKYYVDSEVFLDKTVNYGESVPKPTDPTKTGYAFKGWGEIPETMPAKNLEFYAIFEINSYTITYMIDGVTVNTPTYKYGAEISPYQPAAQEGKEFSGWSPAIPDTMPAYNMTVSGSFNASMFTITYYVDETQYESPQSVKFGEAVTPMTAPTKEGYTFKGWDWNGDEEGLGEAPQTMPAKHLSIHGYFTINSYCVTFHHNNGTNNTTTSVEFNSSITEPNVSRLGYKLDGWYLEDSFTTKWDFNNPMPANDIDLYAKWNLDAYTIKLHNGSDVQSISYNITQDVSLPSASKEGYTFNGWFEQNSQAAFEYIKGTTVGNKDLYAVWQINQYTITFESNDGSPVKNITEDYGSEITKPTDPTKTGYTFGGWFTDNGTFNNEYSFTTIPAKNITLYAKWTAKSYNVTFHCNNGIDNTTTSVEFDNLVAEPKNVSRLGYTLDGWYSDESFTTIWDFNADKMPAENIDLYAKWTLITYKISFNLAGGPGSIQDMDYTVEISITLPTPTREGYVFMGWYENDGKFEYIMGQTLGNHSLVAKWTAENYTITYMDGDSELTAESGWPITYTSERATDLPASATKTGYKFAGWYTNADCSGDPVTSIPAQSTGDKVFYAKWTPITYTVIFDANGGTGSMSNQTFTYDEAKSLSENTFTKDYHSFIGWSLVADGDVKYGNSETVSGLIAEENGQVRLYAVWTPTKYKITYDLDGGINNPENISEYTYETETISILPPSKEGYTIKNWTRILPDGTEKSSKGEAVVITNKGTYLQCRELGGRIDFGDLHLIANYTINQYTITFNSNGGSEVSAVTQDYNTPVTKPDNPTKTGYTFAGWYKDNNTFHEKWDFNTDKVPAENITLYARWATGTNTITLPHDPVSGCDFTAKAVSGYDENNVYSGDDFRFTVTFTTSLGNYIPVIFWGSNTIIGPDSQTGLTYEYTIPNVTGSISLTLELADTTALKNLVSSSSSSDYKLSFDGNWTLTVSISNPNADASELISSISNAISVADLPINRTDSVKDTKMPLLQYLPDDATLWENNLAEYIVYAGGYKIVFKQDADAIEEAKIQYLAEIAQIVRLLRENPTYYPFMGYVDETLSTSVGIEKLPDGSDQKYLEIAVLRFFINDIDDSDTDDPNTPFELGIMGALSSNVPTLLAIIGHGDLQYGSYAATTDFSNTDPVKFGQKLVDANGNLNYAYAAGLYSVALDLLNQMNIPLKTIYAPLSDCFDENNQGFGGYANQYCTSETNGIRYTDAYHLRFTHYYTDDSYEKDDSGKFTVPVTDPIRVKNLHEITSDEDVLLKYTGPKNVLMDYTFEIVKALNDNTPLPDEVINSIYSYEFSRFMKGEVIVIDETSGYSQNNLTITSTDGSDVQWYNDHSFIMPEGDVTITINQ